MSNPQQDAIRDKGLDKIEADYKDQLEAKDEEIKQLRLDILTEFIKRWWNDSLKTDTHPFKYIAERLLETPLEELFETETLEDEAKRLNNEV